MFFWRKWFNIRNLKCICVCTHPFYKNWLNYFMWLPMLYLLPVLCASSTFPSSLLCCCRFSAFLFLLLFQCCIVSGPHFPWIRKRFCGCLWDYKDYKDEQCKFILIYCKWMHADVRTSGTSNPMCPLVKPGKLLWHCWWSHQATWSV